MPEWECPQELHRLATALRGTEPRPTYRWSDLLDRVRQAQADGAWPVQQRTPRDIAS